ncbi:hypothetical protein CLOSPO_01284 [Clostridium sporogenes ATCC 15579]|nr:hypothetical protein CLOSPO_01284 [Clostridium sporogenes ATCC 15579]
MEDSKLIVEIKKGKIHLFDELNKKILWESILLLLPTFKQ